MTKLQAATDTVKELACWYIGLLLIAATVYAFAEGTSLADALYWAATTATSTGYGDLSPKTLIGRIDAVMLMHLSIFVIAPMIIVRLIDRMTVHQDAFTHDEQVALRDDVTAVRVMLADRLPSAGFEFRPDLAGGTPEPSLRDILLGYYGAHYSKELAETLTDEYIIAHKAGMGSDA